tara:strand:- start:21 stop:290 length:270 start_codon:yes stop_codon:yes gene_type:complete
MTITEYQTLGPQDQSVAQLGYSIDDIEILERRPMMSLDSYGQEYHYCDETLFFCHYTNSYWTQEWKQEAIPLYMTCASPSFTEDDDITF